jgi:hypothetical protein
MQEPVIGYNVASYGFMIESSLRDGLDYFSNIDISENCSYFSISLSKVVRDRI